MGAPEFTMNRTSRSLSLKPTVSLSRKGQRRRQKKSFIDKRSSSSEQNHLSRKRQEVRKWSKMVVNWRNRRRRSGVVSTAAESRCRSYSLTISRWVKCSHQSQT
ncbi:hypothetical protein HanRHA438_Chr09g0402801 [Helianthus annuus]|nr:hypothetical protein HanIR_Chr09g0421921 [Helianthus annuus]KAJ0888513.1 hypothetical protein HanRHA438_Chr09g0402801 [Helianthus annuus]